MEAENRCNKEIVKQQDAGQRAYCAVDRAYRGNRGDEYTEDKDGDNVCLGKTEACKQHSDAGGGKEQQQRNERILPGRPNLIGNAKPAGLLLQVHCGIRDDVDIQIRSVQYNLLRKRRLAPKVLPFRAASADYDFCRSGNVRVFSNLHCDVISNDRRHKRAALLRKTGVLLQSGPVRL